MLYQCESLKTTLPSLQEFIDFLKLFRPHEPCGRRRDTERCPIARFIDEIYYPCANIEVSPTCVAFTLKSGGRIKEPIPSNHWISRFIRFIDSAPLDVSCQVPASEALSVANTISIMEANSL